MRRSNGGNQARLGDDRIDPELQPHRSPGGPVQCLGMTFESDEARRAYFLERLREKLSDPEFRKIEGFPIGKDEDILALSDPPYYTSCPNPFLERIIKKYCKSYDPKKDVYRCESFAGDVSEGKYDRFYKLHPYPTKVPHLAIMRYILHYTAPGDVVFDGFCGTGMTAVAAQMCGDKRAVQSLGYEIDSEFNIFRKSKDGQKYLNTIPFSKLGVRYSIINDLSPAATFIAYNCNTLIDNKIFEHEGYRFLEEVEKECGWMYLTLHRPNQDQIKKATSYIKDNQVDSLTRDSVIPLGRMKYTVWSDVFICPECAHEIIFWNAAVDKDNGKVLEIMQCPNCSSNLAKKDMQRAWVTKIDKSINKIICQAKQVPVLISYTFGTARFNKVPDSFDCALIEKINDIEFSMWFPTDRMPEGEESRRNDKIGITNIHHFYSKRNLCYLASFLNKIDTRKYLFTLTRVSQQITKLYRFTYQNGVWGAGGGPLSGTLYIPSLIKELAISEQLKLAIRDQVKTRGAHNLKSPAITTQSSSNLNIIQDNCIDYIFVDPPFGGNLMYSELNILWEAWFRIFTNNKMEAIENKVQKKGLMEYKDLMFSCFSEFFRILKPGRWITIEFHNSKNSVWNAIQDALLLAGFVIADVRTLDKKKGTFKQVTSGGTVKQDLIISAYKPSSSLEERFKIEAETEDGVWDFVRDHLQQLPIFVSNDGQAEIIVERQNFLLFDRMVAFHLRRGAAVPISAAEFYTGLAQRFPERDGMFFLSEQAAEYDNKRMNVKEIIQLQLSVIDESSAIQWLKQQLAKKPQTLQDLTPTFMKELAGWSKHEKLLELRELLDQSFIMYEGEGDVPGPIHSYLSTTFDELRNLTKTDPTLMAKAKNRWYIPDHRRAGDLEKLREKALLKEFHLIAESKKRIKEFRIEAVRAGFKKCWDEGDHKTILDVAKKLPSSVVEEDSHLLMYTDLARMRQG